MGEKTEEPTPQKMRDARKKGQVAKSKDFSGAFAFLIGAVLLLKTAPGAGEKIRAYLLRCLDWAMTDSPQPGLFVEVLKEGTSLIIEVTLPVLAAVMVLGGFLMFMQVGSLFVTEPLKPDIKKLNPIAGLKNMFKMQTLITLILSSIKLGGALILCYLIMMDALHAIMMTGFYNVRGSVGITNDIIFDMVTRCGVFFVAMGVMDFAVQKWQHKKGLKMSKDDIKQEYKGQEGDPEIKGKRKQIAMETAFGGGAKAAAKADAVVTNPNHLATAVQYDRENWNAPRMVAKGQNLMAEKIKEIAKEAGVPIIHNVPLAQALYELETDEEIPEALYEAVAEVLSFVYRLAQEEGRE
ncbi:MAG: EscU/YscU/HrcU family type III secretion system export apparatus switch protein [Candidatus Schekmanbacteria bacterium]|nr:EscU/YscU/HrcU family type III secretion system export apparatus switch protein [Candidatus Schekmanbacteria bacterium]